MSRTRFIASRFQAPVGVSARPRRRRAARGPSGRSAVGGITPGAERAFSKRHVEMPNPPARMPLTFSVTLAVAKPALPAEPNLVVLEDLQARNSRSALCEGFIGMRRQCGTSGARVTFANSRRVHATDFSILIFFTPSVTLAVLSCRAIRGG